MSDADFWASSFRRIKFLCYRYAKENNPDLVEHREDTQTITSMKEIVGWN